VVGKTLAESGSDVIRLKMSKALKDQAYGAGREAQTGILAGVKAFNKDLSGSNVFSGLPRYGSVCPTELNAFIGGNSPASKLWVLYAGSGKPDGAIKAMTEKITAKGGKVCPRFV